MQKPAILIVGRDEALRRCLKTVLLLGFEILESSDKAGALQSFQRTSLDLIILSSSLDGGGDGLEVARRIRRWDRRIPIILITVNSSEDLAIAALRAGINDYFRRPFAPEDLVASINRCLAESHPAASMPKYETTTSGLVSNGLIGESPAMREIRAYTGKVASTDSNVLITGETGTGKELAAEVIHRSSPRSQGPFVCINCAAIPDSLLESELFGYERGAFTGAYAVQEGRLKLAEGGTAFFDEIGDMSPYAQAKILRAIESKEVHRLGGRRSVPLNFRIISATHQEVDRLVEEEGKFRKDLYFRLNVVRLHLPPLRDRKEDIPILFDHYIREFNRRFGQNVEGFTDEALESLLRYEWPGNVRELKNLLEAIFVNLPPSKISFIDLPEQFRRRLRDTEGLPLTERDRLLSALFSTSWNKSKAAQQLHWSRMTLYRKMAKHHITRGGEAVTSRSSM